jgi:DNA topoisomerase 2-associated protein PAT1
MIKEEVDLFANAVIPALLSHLNEEPLVVTSGLLGLIISRCDVGSIVRTKTGLSILTILVSRAEVLKEALAQNPQQQAAQSMEWQQYTTIYNEFFNALEPMLPHLFRDPNPLASDDVYVWQFLAAMGAAASAEQQQRLVLGVKDRVMHAVSAARTLPSGEQERRLGEVNLFMRALGLDVELLA